MFAFQPKPSSTPPQLRVITNPTPQTKPTFKAVWVRVDGQLVCRWIKD